MGRLITRGRSSHCEYGKYPLRAELSRSSHCCRPNCSCREAGERAFRETAFDLVLAADHRLRRPVAITGEPQVVVVDLDRRSLDAVGPWPWPRATMATLVEAIAAAEPSVAAIDILFADHDSRPSPALARRLGAPTARDASSGPSETLPDGEKLLAEAISRLPLVLGFVLDPAGSSALPKMPVAMRGSPPLNELWRAPALWRRSAVDREGHRNRRAVAAGGQRRSGPARPAAGWDRRLHLARLGT